MRSKCLRDLVCSFRRATTFLVYFGLARDARHLYEDLSYEKVGILRADVKATAY
jgi:hypothetical protein